MCNVEIQAEGGRAKCGANNRKEPDGERRTFLFAVREAKSGTASVNQGGMEFLRAMVTSSPRRISVSHSFIRDANLIVIFVRPPSLVIHTVI